MQELSDGRWSIDSAFEAHVVGRAAAYNDPEGSAGYLPSHVRGEPLHYNDEVEFCAREREYGGLVISRTMAQKASAGLSDSYDRGNVAALNGEVEADQVPADIAKKFLQALGKLPETHEPDQEVPGTVPEAA